MKRASLTVLPKTQKAETPDLTDRLLDRDSPARPAKPSGAARKPAKPAAARPEAKKPAPKPRKPKRIPATSPPPSSEPISPADKSVPSVDQTSDPLDDALAQSQAALAGLKAAALAEPGRYDLALRYRLDALAHHLRQVAEFVETSVRRQRGG